MIEEIQKNIDNAQQFLKKKDLVNAESLLKKNLKISKDSFETFFLLGFIYGTKKNFNEAILNLEKAISLKPNHINSILNLAIMLKKIDKIEKSIGFFKKVINLDEKNLEAYCGIADIYEYKGELKEAEKFYQKILYIDNSHHIANHRYGKLLLKVNQHDKGLKIIEKGSGMIKFRKGNINIV